MAAPETIGIVAFYKWAAGIVGTLLVCWITWLTKQVSNQYTKEETEKQIALHMQPYINSVDANTEAVKELTQAFNSVQVNVAEVRTDVKNIKDTHRSTNRN